MPSSTRRPRNSKARAFGPLSYDFNATTKATIMYDRDMPVMRDHALASPEGLTDIISFVLCTIQQPLQSVKNQMVDVRANGAASKYLFGSKKVGYAYAVAHAEVLHAAVTKAVEVNDVIGAVDI